MKMSPNAVFNGAMAKIRTNEEVKQTFRENFKTYGRDHGGHREGRMNLVEHTEYKYVNTDGSKRTSRVRFNLEGQYGMAFVFAEVSDSMPSGEFVCVVVQDKRNGAVVNVGDNNNRSMLLARKMAGGSDLIIRSRMRYDQGPIDSGDAFIHIIFAETLYTSNMDVGCSQWGISASTMTPQHHTGSPAQQYPIFSKIHPHLHM